MLRSYNRVLWCLLALLLVGCGFHLRGSAQIPPRWNPIYLEPGQLQAEQLRQTKRALVRASAQLSAQREDANRLYITLHAAQSRLLASSSPSDIELRQLNMSLEFRLENSAGETLIDNQQLQQSREVELDKSNVLAAGEVLESVGEDLQQALIRNMIMNLSRR